MHLRGCFHALQVNVLLSSVQCVAQVEKRPNAKDCYCSFHDLSEIPGSWKEGVGLQRKCGIVSKLRKRGDVVSVCSESKRICFHPGRACQHESAGTQQEQLPSPS